MPEGIMDAAQRSRTRTKSDDSSCEDRISSLPDEVLTQIFYFLPTKDVVATSILSSRWRNLYKLIILDFDDTVLFDPRELDLGNENRNITFQNFVSRKLERCKKSYIRKFRLKCGNFDSPVICDWIRAALLLCVTELEFSIDKRVHCELRLAQSLCQNLVVLKLDCNFRVCVPKPLTFPCLKVLLFKDITFGDNFNSSVPGTSHFRPDFDDHSLNGILSCCPLLEELVIVRCELQFSQLRRHFEVQLSKFTCQNLMVLKLDCKFTLSVLDSVTFPWLKVLWLTEVTFKGNSNSSRSNSYHGLNGILSACPLLEELVVDGCNWKGGDLYFMNHCLQSLTLKDGLSGPIDQLNGSTVYFDLPNLVSFNYCVGLAESYEIRDLSSVVVAHLVICFDEDDFDTENFICNAFVELIGGIRGCQSLSLSSQCLEALTSDDFELPMFCKLTQLELTLGNDVYWSDVLLDFLYCSPRLESLILGQGVTKLRPSQRDGQFLLEAKAMPSCVASQLKFISIEDFRGFKGERKMVSYFLKYGNVLQEMVIHWDPKNNATDSLAIEEEILKVPKSSPLCSIVFK